MVGGGHGRDVREGIYVYIWLIHFVVQQRLTQHCKAIILHFKKKERRKWAELGCSEHRWAALWEKGHLLQGPHLRSNEACSSCFHFIHLILLPSASQFPINRPAPKHFCFCTRRIIVYNYKDVLWFCVLYPPPASPIFMFFSSMMILNYFLLILFSCIPLGLSNPIVEIGLSNPVVV